MKREELKAPLEQATGISPANPDLLAILATEDLGNFQLEEASEKIRRGLQGEPEAQAAPRASRRPSICSPAGRPSSTRRSRRS